MVPVGRWALASRCGGGKVTAKDAREPPAGRPRGHSQRCLRPRVRPFIGAAPPGIPGQGCRTRPTRLAARRTSRPDPARATSARSPAPASPGGRGRGPAADIQQLEPDRRPHADAGLRCAARSPCGLFARAFYPDQVHFDRMASTGPARRRRPTVTSGPRERRWAGGLGDTRRPGGHGSVAQVPRGPDMRRRRVDQVERCRGTRIRGRGRPGATGCGCGPTVDPARDAESGRGRATLTTAGGPAVGERSRAT
jgi:hypothetical protein